MKNKWRTSRYYLNTDKLVIGGLGASTLRVAYSGLCRSIQIRVISGKVFDSAHFSVDIHLPN